MGKESLSIRIASPDDAEEIRNIYAPYVRETAITFEYNVPSVKEFRGRMQKTLEKYPYLVAERAEKFLAMLIPAHLSEGLLMTGLQKQVYM